MVRRAWYRIYLVWNVIEFYFFIRWNLNYGKIWDEIFFIMLENLIIGTKNLGIWNILLYIGLIKLRWRIWLVQLRFLFIGLIEFNLINAAKNLVHNCNSLFFLLDFKIWSNNWDGILMSVRTFQKVFLSR